MTVLLVLFLFLAFVGTDQVVRAVASRHANAHRDEGLESPARPVMPVREPALHQAANPGSKAHSGVGDQPPHPTAIRLVAAIADEETPLPDEYLIPGGTFVSKGHAWARIEPSGEIRVGVDDFAQKAAGAVSQVALPRQGQDIRMGEPLFTLKQGAQELHFSAPVSGKVVEGNAALAGEAISSSPYLDGWVCRIHPTNLSSDLATMRIGEPVLRWYDEEIHRLEDLRASKKVVDWADLESEFMVASR